MGARTIQAVFSPDEAESAVKVTQGSLLLFPEQREECWREHFADAIKWGCDHEQAVAWANLQALIR